MGCLSSKDKVLMLDPNRLTLDHFEKLRVIGKGAFGKVHAVSRRDTKVLYAMKVLDKQEIVNQRMTQNVLNERFILAALSYPLIVNLRCALQSPVDLFMIVDLMQGGDVRYHMRQDKRFTEERVKFYCAQTALALNFLHSQGYVHRDIKPDNLLLDSDGNCHLTDFNLSVKLPEEGIRGIAGTRPYMAPEVLHKKLYGTEIDWWSFGVMLYEMMFWRLPFHGDADRLRYAILNEEPRFPKEADKHLANLIKGLLDKNPDTRSGFKEVRSSPWFKGIEWEKVETKEAPTPWQPDPNRANCDGSYDLDEQFEVKKKRYPLPAEQEASFSAWDWQPGQKDEVPHIQPEDKERGYDADDAGVPHSEASHSEEEPKKKRRKSAKKAKKDSEDDEESEEVAPKKRASKQADDSSAEAEPAPKKKKKAAAKSAKPESDKEDEPEEKSEASSEKKAPAEENGDADSADQSEEKPAPAKKTKKKSSSDEAESAPEAAHSKSESAKEADSDDEPAEEKPKKKKKKAAVAVADVGTPKKGKKKKAT